MEEICGYLGREIKMAKNNGKYMRGQKFEIEIAEVHTHYTDNNKPFSVYRIKGFKSLFLDDYALDLLINQKRNDEDGI